MFPDIHKFQVRQIGPYERSMGNAIAALLTLFRDRVPDRETNARVLELSITTDRWSAGHKLFSCVRNSNRVQRSGSSNAVLLRGVVFAGYVQCNSARRFI